jgi:two-component system invasion response regulator UvrY
MPNILLADDHEVVRKGLIQILAKSVPDLSVDEAVSGHEALAWALKTDYALVVLDISMPGRGGIEVLREIRSRRPKIPVLILSMHPEEEYAVRALRAGASGYVTKDSAAEELAAAVRRVLAGGRYVSGSLAERLAGELKPSAGRMPHETLSDREYQVMRMLAAGKTVKEIGEELSLSVKTISTYRSRVLEKMRLRNNAEIARYAVENRLTV